MTKSVKIEEMPDSITQYLNEISQIPLLSQEEEIELLKRVAQGDPRAKEKLITANLRLVVNIAKDYTWSGIPLLDLIQAGNIGLINAPEKFDLSKGCRFSTFAHNEIYGAVTKAVSKEDNHTKIGPDTQRQLNNYRKAVGELLKKGQTPTVEELAKKLNVSEKKLKKLQQLHETKSIVSLDAPISDGDSTIGENLSSAQNGISELVTSYYNEELVKFLKESPLTPYQLDIIMMYFGLDGNTPMNSTAIGKKYGVTRQAIEQQKARALRTLAPYLTEKGFNPTQSPPPTKEPNNQQRKRRTRIRI